MAYTHFSYALPRRVTIAARAALLVSTAFTSTPLLAQSSTERPAADANDIIVTARRAGESIRDAPVVVSVLTADALKRAPINDVQRIGEQIPQLSIIRGSSSTLLLRGIGQTTADPGIEQSVLTNIDGVLLSRSNIINAGFLDVAQVEVLKGPQALFFGKNASAGVLSIKSADPGPTFEAGIKGGYEFVARERFVEGFISGPVTDNLGVRVALRARGMDGWLKNETPHGAPNPRNPSDPIPGGDPRYSNTTEYSGRVTIDYHPDVGPQANLKVLHSSYRNNGSSGNGQPVRCAPGQSFPTSGGFPDIYSDCVANDKRGGSYEPAALVGTVEGDNGGVPFTKTIVTVGTLNLNWDFGSIKLTGTTGYYDSKTSGFDFFDYTSYPLFPGANGEDAHQFSQEIRLLSEFESPLNFVIGGYYDDSHRYSYNRGGAGYQSVDPATNRSYSNDRRAQTDGNTYSVFGQLIWNVTDALELAGGARYTHEDKTGFTYNAYVHPNFVATLLPVGQVLRGKFKDNNVSPELTAKYKINPDVNIYAAYKNGYKSGGFSNPAVLTRVTIQDLTFQSERARGGEIGLKARAFDHRLAFNLALYDYAFSDLQLATFDQATASYFINNAGTAITRGAEANANFTVSRSLLLRAEAVYNRAKFTSFANAPCYSGQTVALGCVRNAQGVNQQDLTGLAKAYSPKYILNAGFTADHELGSDLKVELTGDMRYSSSYRTQDDGAPYAVQHAFTKYDASLSLVGRDDKWRLSLIGRNLTNEYTVLSTNAKAGGLPGELTGVVARPREVYIQASYNF